MTDSMEVQPRSSRKRKRPETQDVFEEKTTNSRKRKRAETQDVSEEKITNLSLDDLPTPPGVDSFPGVDGQKVAQPRDAAPATVVKEDQAGKKRAPINDEESQELHKLTPLSKANLAKHNRDVQHGLEDIARWETMTTKEIEDLMPDVEDFCATEWEKIRATNKVIEEYNNAIKHMKRRCACWQREVDSQDNALHRAKAFLRQREIEEAATSDNEPPRKRRRRG